MRKKISNAIIITTPTHSAQNQPPPRSAPTASTQTLPSSSQRRIRPLSLVLTGQRNDNTGDDNIGSQRSNKTVASDLNLGALLVTKESSDVIKYYVHRIINYELSAFGQLSAPKIPLHFTNTIHSVSSISNRSNCRLVGAYLVCCLIFTK